MGNLTKIKDQILDFPFELQVDLPGILKNLKINERPLSQITIDEKSQEQMKQTNAPKNETSLDGLNKNSVPRYGGNLADTDFLYGEASCDPLKLLTNEKSKKKRSKEENMKHPPRKTSNANTFIGKYVQDFQNEMQHNLEMPLDIITHTKLSDIPTLNNSRIADETFISQTVHINYSKNRRKEVASGKNIDLPDYINMKERSLNTGVHNPITQNCKSPSNPQHFDSINNNNELDFTSKETNNLNIPMDFEGLNQEDEEVEVHDIYEHYDSNQNNLNQRPRGELDEYFSTEEDVQRFIEHDILKETHNSTFLLESTTGFYKENEKKTFDKDEENEKNTTKTEKNGDKDQR